ncbi:fatty acid desaturase family protein [Alteromonas oceanisediminis]|uniref:fatty acid desaturase family protein n=1 Tax=Alteromonas oceanisediminis TaxID=2836180 RepID=UPI001BDAACFA|nr:fatty acid desaturase family protein [Alteromonas oceanisediminis]MBT0587245.1 fatty acid desaturase family protein [Alteromonas oceanisediminis]
MQSYQQQLRHLTLRPFMQRSDAKALSMLLVNYALIVLALSIPVLIEQWWALLVAVVLLGNRQLGLGILMHDCAHNALFKTKSYNTLAGEWLCAAPLLAQFEGYRTYHLKHHAKAGTTHDPDYPNYAPYPVQQRSVLRKFFRDIVGITGLKNIGILLMMHAGVVNYDMAYKSVNAKRGLSLTEVIRNLAVNLYRAVMVHALFVSILLVLGQTWLYGVWWAAYLTTFSLFSRIRNAAEHAAVPNLLDADPRLHARTVTASWLARLTVAPNHVNYHIEHHWLPQVPPYNLPALHRYLIEHNALEGAEILPDYWAVIRKLA